MSSSAREAEPGSDTPQRQRLRPIGSCEPSCKIQTWRADDESVTPVGRSHPKLLGNLGRRYAKQMACWLHRTAHTRRHEGSERIIGSALPHLASHGEVVVVHDALVHVSQQRPNAVARHHPANSPAILVAE